MATEVSSDAQKVLAGLDSAAQQYITSQGSGNKLTSGEARTLLAAYQADPSKALSATNVAAASTAPTYAPDDLLGIRNSISNELGISDKESAYSTAYKTLKDYDLETENAARLINEQQISTNVLSGQEATARKLRSQERMSLASEAEIAQAALLAAKEELNTRYGIQAANVAQIRQIILSNPEAGITFSDTTESAAKKIADYNKKVQKKADEAEKDAYKDKLKSTLVSLGISTKNSKGGSLSSSKMEKALTEYYKKQGMDEQEMKDLEKALKKKSLSDDGSGGYSDSDIQAYVDAYGKGQITAPNIPTKIRDQVLAGAAPIIKERVVLEAKNDIYEFMHPYNKETGDKEAPPSREQTIRDARATYPELSQDEIIGIVNDITNSDPEQGGIINWFKSIF